MNTQSEIAQLRERLFREAQAVYLGLYGLSDEQRFPLIHQRNQQMYRTLEQLQARIGTARTTTLICKAYDAQYKAWYRESEPLRLQALEQWNREWQDQK